MAETRITKYMTIKNDLQNKILTGVYRPGDLIPSDNELMQTLGVSKSTITQALKQLESEGYITRKQGKGSFVSEQFSLRPTLSFYVSPMDSEEKNFWDSVVSAFNEDTSDFSVELHYLTNDDAPIRDKLLQTFVSGEAPDLITLDGPDVPYWVYMKTLLPLDEFLDLDFRDSFLKEIIQQGSYNGHLYHLGYTESSLCLLYNKELFKSLGIHAPSSIEEAWSWHELTEVCQTLKEKTSYQYPLLMDSGRGISTRSGEWICYTGLSIIKQNHGEIFNKDMTKTSGYINGTAAVDAMKWAGELFYKYHYTHTEPISETLPEDFAMSLSLPSVYFQNFKKNNNLGIIPLPHGITSASPHGSWGICITRQTKHPELCARFIKYIFSIKNQIKLGKYTGIPVLNEIYEVMESFSSASNHSNILLNQLQKTSFTRPQTPAYPFFSSHFALAFSNICNGSDAQIELDRLADMVDNHLLRHHY